MRRIGLAALLALFAAVAWWVIGFLPWVQAGFSWPTTEAAPVGSSSAGLAGVKLALPLVAIDLPFLIAAAVIGAVVAGLAPIAFTGLSRWFAVVWVWLAVAATVALTSLLSVRAIRVNAGTDFAGDKRVLEGLAVVLLVATLLGLLAGSISVVRHGFTSIAAALVAGSVGVWVNAFLIGNPHGPAAISRVRDLTDVAVAVILALGLAVSVHRTARSALWWPVAAVVVWCAGPAYTAYGYLAGQLRPSAGLPGSLPSLVAGSRHVFWEALKRTHPEFWPLLVGLGVGLLSLAATVLRRRHAASRTVAADQRHDESVTLTGTQASEPAAPELPAPEPASGPEEVPPTVWDRD